MILYQAAILRVALTEMRHAHTDLAAPVVQSFRAWPWMCDGNRHINNARYLTYMDYGRTAWVARTGVAAHAFRRKYAFVLGGSTLTYRRSLDMMRPFALETRLAGWDERWFYFEQTFRDEQGRFAARGLVRGSVRDGRDPVSMPRLFEELSLTAPDVAWTDELSAWVDAAGHTLDAVKADDARRSSAA